MVSVASYNIYSFCLTVTRIKLPFIIFSGLTSYLNVVHDVYMPPHRDGYCDVSNAAIFTVFLCSALFIVSMTFERLYSITRPHKAASFNTVKRAKITIMSIVFLQFFTIFHICLSVLFWVGNVFLMEQQWVNCTEKFTIGFRL